MIKIKVASIAIFLLGIAVMPLSYSCIYISRVCYGGWVDRLYDVLIQPLYFFALFGVPAVLIALFFKPPWYRSWLKYSFWFALLALVFISLTPTSSPYLLDFYPFYRIDAARVAGELFVAGTILFVLYSYWKSRRS